MAANEQPYHTPEWAKHVIWYQIFPERFRNGDPSNDPTAERVAGDEPLPPGWAPTPWTGDWYERAEWEKVLGPSFRDGVFFRRYGGDLQGIIDKLDYLQELGISAIYLNPIFDAVSLHKFDTSHYRHVDRFFGPDPAGDARIMEAEDPHDPDSWQWTSADRLFLRLIHEVHQRDMKIIIDGVFNHTGTDFWAFRDLKQKQQQSDYRGWYEVRSFRDAGDEDSAFDYAGWWGVKDLPELRQEQGTLIEPIRMHIAHITRRWMDPDGDGDPADGVDGWRLDVPEEIGTAFWKEWCALVRQINPEAYITGEIWDHKAAGYIRSDLFTGVMNYQFAKAVQDYLIDRDISVTAFEERLRGVRRSFPDEANYVVQNLMDSHDTPRLASMILNPGREYDSLGKPEEGFSVRKPNARERRLHRLIALFQLTYIGAPMIYYGTEAGMWGADDPDNRKPMLWPDLEYEPERAHPLGTNRPADENRFDRELFNWYRRLCSIRNSEESLQTGSYQTLLTDDDRDLLAFMRRAEGARPVVVVLNGSEQEQRPTIPTDLLGTAEAFTDRLTGDPIPVTGQGLLCTLAPLSGRVLVPGFSED